MSPPESCSNSDLAAVLRSFFTDSTFSCRF
jgi:hypothetical protein